MARPRIAFEADMAERTAPDAVLTYRHRDGVGRALIWPLHDVGNEGLGRDLAMHFGPLMGDLFDGLAVPTVKQHWQSWTQLGKLLTASGRLSGGLRTLTAADIDACDVHGQYSRFRCLIYGLRVIGKHAPSLLSAEVKHRLNFVSRHSGKALAPREPLTPFVAEALKRAADRRVAAARDRIFAGRRQLDALRSEPNPSYFDRAFLRAAEGIRPTKAEFDLFRHRRVSIAAATGLAVTTLPDAVYFVIALALRVEIPIECLRTLRRDCLKNASRGFVTIEYVKSRAGPRHTIKRERVRDGGITTPGGIIRLALDLSQPAAERMAGRGDADAEYLWVGFVEKDLPTWRRFRLCTNNFRRAISALSVIDENGVPIAFIAPSRLRKTVKRNNYLRHAGHLRRFASDHSRSVAARHYAAVEALDEEHAQSIVAAETQLFDIAMNPVVLSAEAENKARVAGLALPGRAMDGPTAATLMAGSSDTFLGICMDFWASPIERADDGSCAAAFTGCLHCRNAIFTRRKLPALLTYMDWLSDRRSVLSETRWNDEHGADFNRITQQILPAFTDADMESARLVMSEEAVQPVLPLHIKRV
jgi:hypothetical protein